MSPPDFAWRVLEHGPLEQFAENLWWVTGAIPGMSLKRTMVVARRGDGSLVIHNAIAMNEAQQQQLERLGTPAFLLVPNGGHRIDAPRYKKRYPALRVFAPRGSMRKVQQVIAVDGAYNEFPHDEVVRLEHLHGVGHLEGAMWVRSNDGVSLVLNDIVMNMDKKRDPLGFFFTTVLGSAPGPRVSRLAKLTLVKDKLSLKQDLERFASTPALARLFVAHEKVAHGADAKAALERAMTFL